MASTFVMAGFGFFFWMINARLFTPEQVGLATTIISAMGLITSFSLLGLNNGLIRYLPMSERKNDKISTCFLVTALAIIIISVIFLVGLKTFSPRLFFIRENLPYALFFIFFMLISSSSNIIESVFIAFRNTKYILIQGTIFSILKLILPFSLVALGAYGIFSSWMLALTTASSVSFIVLIKKFGFKPRLVINTNIIKKIGRFSFGNYIAGFLGGLPTMILPLMITNLINPEKTAYYYMAMMIASLLFIIPQATTQSLFAEGSHDGKELKQHVKKAARIILLILIPAILITLFLGKYILLAYGKNYSHEGLRFLQLLALSSIFVSFNSIFGTILKIEHKIIELIFISLLSAILIIGLSYLFINRGLLGVGLAWIAGNMLIGGIYLAYWTLYRHHKEILNINNLF
jgi:O-antigen/teichoic acid export membrane protein